MYKPEMSQSSTIEIINIMFCGTRKNCDYDGINPEFYDS